VGGALTVRQDAQYARFFKMIDMGIPGFVVKQKAQLAGLDPALLDTPDAPAPTADA
jgi:hypothetical protein